MELNVKNRVILGKKVRTLRREGLIPAEIYGHGISNLHVSLNEKEFEKIYRVAGEHKVIDAINEKKEKIPVIIVSAVKNPITQKFISADLRQISMDEEINAKVPIEFIGEAPATKTGLILVKVINELEIKALPENLPNVITVNIKSLAEAHQSIAVKDLKLPKTIKISIPEDAIIITVTEHKEEVKETPPSPPESENAPTTDETPETTTGPKF